jgi:hypothetical protein
LAYSGFVGGRIRGYERRTASIEFFLECRYDRTTKNLELFQDCPQGHSTGIDEEELALIVTIELPHFEDLFDDLRRGSYCERSVEGGVFKIH